MRVDEAAAQVVRERGARAVWYGNPDLLHDIADRAGIAHSHPLNTISTVLSQVARSPLFARAGRIEHMGRRYPVYELREGAPDAGR